MKTTLFFVLSIFITIAASNHYFVNYGYKPYFTKEYKRGYVSGCLNNTQHLTIQDCKRNAINH